MDRIKQVQEYIADNDLEGFLVLTKINRQYLSGFTGSVGILAIWKKRSELYVDDRYLIRARKESPLLVVPLTRVSAALSHKGRGVGIEDKITLRESAMLKKQYPRVKWRATSDIVENLRAVKSLQEIRYIQKGSEIVDATFWHIVKMLGKNSPNPSLQKRGGRGEYTEIDVAQEIAKFGKKLGADGLAFDPIVAWGPNAAAPHHFSSAQKIRRGNFLLLDFGFLVNGYHSDFTRTLFMGSPSKKQEKVYNTVLEAQIRAIKKIRPKTGAASIDAEARRYIAKRGFGKYFTHNTGHGVGLEIHELPNFSQKSEDVLVHNMVVTVEPGIYLERWGGVRIEDMVIVKDGPVVVSSIPKDLKSMIV